MNGRFRRSLVWACITTGALALGAGCRTDYAIADDELIEEQEGVLEPGVGGAGNVEEDGIIAPADEGVDDGLFEQGEADEDESVFEPGVGGAGDEGLIEEDAVLDPDVVE